MKKGDIFELYCEGLAKYKVRLSQIFPSQATAEILKSWPVPPLKKPYLHLALALARLQKMDFLIEKAVEIGVKSFHPFSSQLSFFKKSSQLPSSRLKRWNKIVEQSMALTGRTEKMSIKAPLPLREIKIPKGDLALMAYEGQRAVLPLAQLLQKNPQPSGVWLFIGAEGGFSAEEAKEFSLREKAFVFSMGEQILRLETAGLLALGILKYHYLGLK